MNNYNTELWLKEYDLTEIPYSQYWNDEQEEKKKDEWYSVMNGEFVKMEKHISDTGLLQDLKECINVLRVSYGRELCGVGIDLAAGVLWPAPYLFDKNNIKKLYMVEYSKHRLFELGPKVLDFYKVPKDKIVLALGNFYDIHLANSTVDFILLSSAFHHADKPDVLLSEINRVLKRNGVVIVIGEPIAHLDRVARHVLKYLISKIFTYSWQKRLFGRTVNVPRLFVRPEEPISIDEYLGDRLYTNSQYESLFVNNGFSFQRIRKTRSLYQSFLLIKNKK